LIPQLADPRSSERRAAARRLRAAGDPHAGPALLEALEKEVGDRRTWETQYQMIMALAASGPSVDAIAILEHLLTLHLEPMVHLAASDAIVRSSQERDTAVVIALRSGSLPRAEGAIRALAMTHAIPAERTILAVIGYANEAAHKQVRFWVAAAAPGWQHPSVRPFLEECLNGQDAETRRAAQAAIEGHYLKWNPL
jgi:HEAT repeat protein